MNTTRKKKKPSWGYHLLLDASHCHQTAIRSKKTIADFVKKVVKEINMKAYGRPRIVNFGTGKRKGYTLVQLIQTSDITAHFSEEEGSAYVDIFSCKEFDQKTAIHVFRSFFHPQRIRSRFLKRQA